MHIALFDNPALLAPFHGLYRWVLDGFRDGLMDGSAAAVRPMQRNSLRQSSFAAKPAYTAYASGCIDSPGNGSGCPTVRPLRKPTPRALPPVRMIRLREAGQARASVGRMVISGRMADVCAELDRLAACEAALH
jgi:hypothetical protein